MPPGRRKTKRWTVRQTDGTQDAMGSGRNAVDEDSKMVTGNRKKLLMSRNRYITHTYTYIHACIHTYIHILYYIPLHDISRPDANAPQSIPVPPDSVDSPNDVF
jgi:hypothetical protein